MTNKPQQSCVVIPAQAGIHYHRFTLIPAFSGMTIFRKAICIQRPCGINIGIVKTKLKELLSARQKQRIDDPERIASAVLIPLYQDREQYHIVFIKRTDTVKTHKGQISFPGGGRERGDKTLLDTALREASEEIGLLPGDVEVLGELDDEITTTSNYIVSPFVALIPWPYRFTREKAEVAEIISIPVPALLDKSCLKEDIETLDGGIVVNSYNYHYKGQVIWGATAKILHKLLDILARVYPEAR
jgi:8-oxo-dGTP pyrophosphatase MutT (NUDIX family)